MKASTILLLLISIASIGTNAYSANKNNSNNIMKIAVGTYTSSGSKGIYLGKIDIETGKMTISSSIEQKNPSFLCISQDGKNLYAVTETEDSNAGVTAYRINGETPKRLNTISGIGGSPCNISTNGNEVAIAEYGGGSLTRIALNSDGSLGKELQHTVYYGHGVNPRSQAKPHIHSAQYHGTDLYITDLGCDKMYIQHKDTNIDTIQFTPNFGPRHFVFSQDGKYMYVIGELSGKVCMLSKDGNTYLPTQYILSDLTAGENGKGSADIHLSPDGKFLYTSNRLKDDGISTFAINGDGSLKRIAYTHTGIHPRNFTITPNGKWLIVACRDSNSIEFYKRNISTGELQKCDRLTINTIQKPVCLQVF